LAAAIWLAREWPLRARLFPWTIGIPLLIVSVIHMSFLLREVFGTKQLIPSTQLQLNFGRGFSIYIWIVAFAIGLWLFGFRVGSPLLALFFLKFASGERWKTAIVFALTIYLCLVLGFSLALRMEFPPGAIARAFSLESFDSYVFNLLLRAVAELLPNSG
jgi:hypothetical protein